LRKLWSAALTISLVQVACTPRTDSDAEWVARFSHVYPINSDYQLMAERFKDLMEERTGSRFRVVIFPSGQLGSERVAFEQLQVGAQEMAISGTPVLSGWVPEGQVFDLPFLFETRDQGLDVLNGAVGDWWRSLLLDKTGIRSLGFLDYGFRHVYNSKRPIVEPSDLAGLKLRVLQSRTYISAYEEFGVQATPMNYGEVYSAMQQGVIDGGEANVIGYMTSRLNEVGGYFSFSAITYNPITLLISERFYRSLPEEIQEILVAAAAESLEYQKTVAREMETEAIEQMQAAGVTVTHPSTETFVPFVRPEVWEDLAERLPDGIVLLEWLEKEVEQVSAGEGIDVTPPEER
jgi:tripartite ATP-independent transporter DctP family solute receptor